MVDVRDEFIAKVTPGKSFAEIGGLWGGVEERISVAHAAGASSLTMIDILPPLNDWWGVFAERMGEKGIEGYRSLSGDIMTMACGPYDVTHSSGILYHLPSPIEYLLALRRVTREHCIMTSASIPRKIKNSEGTITLEGGQAIFVPAMSPQQRKVFAAFYGGHAHGISTEGYTFNTTDFVPWWWLLTGDALVAMSRAAGWEVLDIRENWGGRAHTLLLKNTGRVDSTTIG